MNNVNSMDSVAKPIHRSKLRLRLGKRYYICKRWIYWLFGGIKLARKRDSGRYAERSRACTHEWAHHQTPLLRQLRELDMELQYNKITNLKLASERVNEVMLLPGETFSYWRTIGHPTYRKGYKDGLILFCGTLRRGEGGGLCQLSNMIYWLTLHTPLTVVERYRHSYDVFPDVCRTQPFGSGATCVYNYRDLMIRNDTPNAFKLQVGVTDTHLVGRWLSDVEQYHKYEIYEKNHMLKSESYGHYSRNNEIWRRTFNMDGKPVSDIKITENHALMMYEPFLTDGSTTQQTNSQN